MVQPKYHVFVVDSETYPVHTGKGFCGGMRLKSVQKENKQFKIKKGYITF